MATLSKWATRGALDVGWYSGRISICIPKLENGDEEAKNRGHVFWSPEFALRRLGANNSCLRLSFLITLLAQDCFPIRLFHTDAQPFPRRYRAWRFLDKRTRRFILISWSRCGPDVLYRYGFFWTSISDEDSNSGPKQWLAGFISFGRRFWSLTVRCLGRQILLNNIAVGAMHNSKERYDAPKCHEDTRKAVLKDISTWISDMTKDRLILWLSAPAGSGKSAILQTIAKQFDVSGRLAASFFFSRGVAKRDTENHLISSWVYKQDLWLE